MSRGRGGYSSQRGSSYRGSSRGSGSYMSRGNNSSSGRFSSFSNNSFDNRNRYSGSSSGDHRFSGSRNHDDYRKSYRSDRESNYRDNHHRSPDRKRMRHDASSSRHDNYGGSSSSNYNSSSRYDSSNNFSSGRRSFSSDRHSGGGGGGGGPRSRGSSDFRKPAPPPPSASAPPSRRRISGGFRSGDGGSRMSSRVGGPRSLRMGRERPLPRRRLQGRSYAIRKRAMAARSADYARRLKISRMRRVIAARRQRHRFEENSSPSTPSSTKNKEENSDKKSVDKSVELKTEKDNENAIESSTNISTKKTEKESDKKSDAKSEKEKSPKRDQIKLTCPHCNTSTYKYYAYEMHLNSRLHLTKMRRVALKQKSVLSQMRLAQRNAQNELEKDNDDLASRTNFCPLCKLNYKQRKEVHQQSEAHKNMKKFLMPYCKICHLTCKSPMMYENHCCSIKHIKRKIRMENGTNSEGSAEEDSLENFTTIDSVGDAEEESKNAETKDSVMNMGIEKIKKVEAYYCELCKMYLSRHCSGAEADEIIASHCRNRIHMRNLVRHQEDLDIEKRLKKLQRKEAAEKELKNKETEEATESNIAADQDVSMLSVNENDKSNISTESENKKTEIIEVEDDPVNVRDDKLWEDMDKDIGDLLAEAESGNKSSDEDEEDESHINGERYDRFRQSEKNGDEKSENAAVTIEEKETSNAVTVKEEKVK